MDCTYAHNENIIKNTMALSATTYSGHCCHTLYSCCLFVPIQLGPYGQCLDPWPRHVSCWITPTNHEHQPKKGYQYTQINTENPKNQNSCAPKAKPCKYDSYRNSTNIFLKSLKCILSSTSPTSVLQRLYI